MKPDSELYRIGHETREQARTLRQASEQARRRAGELILHAWNLCARYKSLEARAPEAQSRKEPQRRHGNHELRLEVLEQLKQSFADLESIRMISEHDPQVRALKEDIQRTIRRAMSTKI